MSILRRRGRPIFAPRRRRFRRALTMAGSIAASVMVIAALAWTVARLAADAGPADEPAGHDHPPAGVPSTP